MCAAAMCAWLWKDQNVRDAIRNVVDEQGVPMAVFVGEVP
jgi:hypothetical protein